MAGFAPSFTSRRFNRASCGNCSKTTVSKSLTPLASPGSGPRSPQTSDWKLTILFCCDSVVKSGGQRAIGVGGGNMQAGRDQQPARAAANRAADTVRCRGPGRRRRRPAGRTARRCPIRRPVPSGAASGRRRPASTGRASRTAAASDDPPPKPAPMGMRLRSRNSTRAVTSAWRPAPARRPSRSGYPGCRHRRRFGSWCRAPRVNSTSMTIGQRDGLEDGADFVIAVRTRVQDAQIQVDLGEGAQAGPAGLAHLSYFRSEKTS